MRWGWMVAFALVASACGGGDSGGDTAATGGSDSATTAVSQQDPPADGASPEVVVESVDGLATLSLPAGSLPEGVSPDDVQLSVLVDEAAEPGAPVLAVQLLPHGLVLEEPATLTAALPAALDGGFMVIHRSGDTIEFLDGQVELADDGPMFVTSISHFSELYFSAFDKAFEISVSLTPTEVAEGQTQPAEITMAAKPEPIDARVDFFTDPDRTSRRVRFSAPIPPFQFDRPTIRWGFSWDPIEVPVELSKAATGWEAQASSKCEVPNETKVRFWSSVSFTVELLELGEPESEDLFGFSHFLTSAAGEGASRNLGNIQLLDSLPGDTFSVNGFVRGFAPSVCSVDGVTSATAPEQEQTPFPESLQAATPISVVSVVNGRSAQIDVMFAGDAQDLAEGGARQLGVTFQIFGDERRRVTAYFRSFEGEITASGESEGGPSSEAGVVEDAEVTWELVAKDHLRINITTKSGVVPEIAPHVTVSVQETPDTEILHYVLE